MQGKTFTQKNNYDVPYLKQPKSNPSLSLIPINPIKPFKYHKWKPILNLNVPPLPRKDNLHFMEPA